MLEIYRLEVDSILGLEADSELAVLIENKLDSERKAIVKRASANSSGCATARGTGLLLQYVGKRMLVGEVQLLGDNNQFRIIDLSVDELIAAIDEPIDFQYIHGADGKPYWKDVSMPFFNVSHSDGVVVLAVSDREIGIDIQKIKSKNELQMAERFYSEKEAALVAKSENEGFELFYKFWARKEALGKCTGKGVRPYLDTDTSDINSEFMKRFWWMEARTDDYFMCICMKL